MPALHVVLVLAALTGGAASVRATLRGTHGQPETRLPAVQEDILTRLAGGSGHTPAYAALASDLKAVAAEPHGAAEGPQPSAEMVPEAANASAATGANATNSSATAMAVSNASVTTKAEVAELAAAEAAASQDAEPDPADVAAVAAAEKPKEPAPTAAPREGVVTLTDAEGTSHASIEVRLQRGDCGDCGLLFALDASSSHVAIPKEFDMLFLASDGRVLTVQSRVEDPWEKPPKGSAFVLELPGGFSEEHQVAPGSMASWHFDVPALPAAVPAK